MQESPRLHIEGLILLLCAVLVLLCAIAFPMWKGSDSISADKAFTGVVGLYADESFYYLALGPAEMSDEQRMFGEDKFLRADKAMFINPIGNGIALLSDITKWSDTTSFFLYRMLAAILLAVSFFKLSGLFLAGLPFRILALCLFLFGAGWDGCVNILESCSWTLWAPEMNPFISCVGEYYIPTATALLLFYMERVIRVASTATPQRKDLLTLGVLLFLLGVVYIYSMLIAICITASILIHKWLTERVTTSAVIGTVVWAGLFSLPVIVYYTWMYTNLNSAAQDDGWVMGPTLIETLLTNFWVAVPAMIVVGINLVSNRRKDDWATLAVWVFTVLLITRIPPPYLPFQVQAHVGLSAPLAIITAIGTQQLFGQSGTNRSIKILALSISGLLLFFAVQPNLKFYSQMLNRIEQMEYPEFAHKDELKALEWIRENLPQSATFAVVEEKARMLAGLTGCRVYYKNTRFDEYSETKRVLEAWSSTMGKGTTDCPSVLVKEKVSFVFVDPMFRSKYLEPAGILDIPCSKRIYSSGEVSVWQLNE